MPLPVLTFWIFAAVIVGSGVMVITRKNAITAALFLALSLVAVAGLYVTLQAEFLFAVQVLVYTGGVMVLFLFVIMLVNIDHLEGMRSLVRAWWVPLGLTAVTFGALALHAARGGFRPVSTGRIEPGAMSNLEGLARSLLTDYLLPFEVLSVLLLVAMVGAIVLARKEA